MSEFKTLRTANETRQKEWHKNGPSSLAYKGNELAGEVGEACNIIKKIERERMGSVGSRATPEQLAEELADVIICVDLICEEMKIDLWQAVVDKFNKTSDKNGLQTKIVPL